MNNQIDQTIRRTRSYWNIDGLPEMGFGLLCLLLSAYFTVQSSLPDHSLVYQVLNLFFVLVMIGGSLLSRRLVDFLKRKFTYPRTGYVAYRRPAPSRRILTGLVAGLISALLVTFLYKTDMRAFWLPVITAVAVAAIFTLIAVRDFATRYYFLAIASLTFGAIAALAGLKDLQGLAFYYAGMGLAQLVSGGLVFRNYLLTYRPIEGTEA